MKRRAVRVVAIVVFAAGFLLGSALAVAGVWPDLEASLFDATLVGSAPLNTLRCPMLLTATETATVTASFTNSGPRATRFLVRARVSAGFVTLLDEDNTMLSLAPGETRELQWPVTAEDAAYGQLVLVRVHAFGGSSSPYQNGSCGILLVGLPGGTGSLVLVLALVGSLLLTGAGLWLWIAGNQPLQAHQLGVVYAMATLVTPVMAGVVAGYFGWWGLGLVALALAALMLFTVLGFAARSLWER